MSLTGDTGCPGKRGLLDRQCPAASPKRVSKQSSVELQKRWVSPLCWLCSVLGYHMSLGGNLRKEQAVFGIFSNHNGFLTC